MIPLYTQEQFDGAKSNDKLPCKCYTCLSILFRQKKLIIREIKSPTGRVKYCSLKCRPQSKSTKVISNCKECNNEIHISPYQIIKYKNHFCSCSCSVSYQNKHKTHGIKRSKLEIWLEQELPTIYPTLEFRFNRKDTIGSELDIYIPSLSLAFELNGIFHYEPIFGSKKLDQIQNNDQSKSKACFDNRIDLCTIDVSQFKKFKPKGAQKYLDIITNIIKERLLTS